MIGSAQAYLLRLPYRIGTEPAGEWGGTLDHVLLRIEARGGVIGWGEAFGYRSAPATLAALREIVIPLALELDDIDPATANRRLQRACHQGGRAGPLLHAIAAVDIALWDIAAKRRGEPLYALLGGGRRPTLPAYSSLLHHGDRDAVADACRGGVEAGFTAVKLHDIERDSVRAAREAVGVKLMVEANCAWNADQAAREIAALREFEPHWIEEPIFPPEDFDTLARLMRAIGAPLAAGENSATPSDYQAMMDKNAVSFLQPSVTKIDSVTPMLEILRAVDARHWKVMPHSPYFGPGLLATLHVLASRDDGSRAEIYDPAELEGNPYGHALTPAGGNISVPTRPGLGLDPDETVIRTFAG